MRKLLGTLALSALLIAPSQLQAQFTLGGALGWHDDFDLGIAVYGYTPLPSLHENVSIGGDFSYFFPDAGSSSIDFSYFEINGNLIYSFPDTEMSFTPFVLGGINIARASVDSNLDLPDDFPFDFDVGGSNTDIGLNAGGGISFGSQEGGIRPVVGAKLELGGGEGFVLFGGIGFPVGG